MNYNIIDVILKTKKLTKKYLYEAIEMSKGGFDRTVTNDTLKVRDLEKMAKVLDVPVCLFFNEEGIEKVQNFFNGIENAQVSIGNATSQKGEFGSKKETSTNNELFMLREKYKALEEKLEGFQARLDLKDEIIVLLRER